MGKVGKVERVVVENVREQVKYITEDTVGWKVCQEGDGFGGEGVEMLEERNGKFRCTMMENSEEYRVETDWKVERRRCGK